MPVFVVPCPYRNFPASAWPYTLMLPVCEGAYCWIGFFSWPKCNQADVWGLKFHTGAMKLTINAFYYHLPLSTVLTSCVNPHTFISNCVNYEISNRLAYMVSDSA